MRTHFIPENIVTEAVDVILNTRLLCGNERRAVFEFAHENGVEDRNKLWRIANFRANATWNRWGREAGVPEKHLW